MKKNTPAVVLGLVALIVVAGSLLTQSPTLKIFSPFEVIAFYEKGWDDMTYGYPSLVNHYKDITILMPFWYTVNSDGSVSSKDYESKVASFADSHKNFKMMPLFNNGDSIENMLMDDSVRTTAVENIAKTVTDNNFDGVNIDFELIPPESRGGFTSFIEELSTRLKKNGKKVSVDVFPKVGVSADVSSPYDYAALGKYADYVVLMTYDNHSDSSNPGPVAPIGWVSDNVDYALKSIPADKIILGVADYGYDWSGSQNAEYIGQKEAVKRASDNGANIQWDDTSQSPYYTYNSSDGTSHEVWFESGDSAARKVSIAKDKKLRGIAIWRMGFENEDYWDKLRKAL